MHSGSLTWSTWVAAALVGLHPTLTGCGGDDGGDCPKGGFDLAELADPEGTSTVDLGVYSPTGTADNFLGGPLAETDEIVVCVPDDTVQIAFFARSQPGEIYFTSFRSPGSGEGIDASSLESFAAGINQFYVDVVGESVITPAEDDGVVDPGVYRFRLGGVRTELEAQVAIRRGSPGAGPVPVNLVFLTDVVTQGEQDQIIAGSDTLAYLLGLAGIDIELGFGTFTGDYAPFIDDLAGRQKFASAAITGIAGEPLPQTSAVNLYFTAGAKSGSICAAGISTGLPGVPNDPRSPGVILDMELVREGGGNLNMQSIWQTAGHEILHFLGLYHTSESSGLFHDRIEDTPECLEEHDLNGDGFVEALECPDGNNLMFWEARDIMEPEITAGQQRVLSGNFFAP